MLGLYTMELFVRLFCLIVVAAHWANAGQDMVFEGQRKPYVRKLWTVPVDQMRPPAVMPKPDLSNQKRQMFPHVKLQKPPLHTQFPPPVNKPRVPTNTQSKSDQSQTLPQAKQSQHHRQVAPYWIKVSSSWYLDKRYPSRQVPGSSSKNPATQMSKPNVWTEKPKQEVPVVSAYKPANGPFVRPPIKKDVKKGFPWKYVKPQVPKYQGRKGVENKKLSDNPDNPDNHEFVPVMRNYVPSVPRWYPAQRENAQGYPVLQKKLLPRFKWSWERQEWVPTFKNQ